MTHSVGCVNLHNDIALKHKNAVYDLKKDVAMCKRQVLK